MKINFHPFPDYLASDEEKIKPEYGLQMGLAIQYEWFKRPSSGSSSYYDRRDKYHKLRLYARGEQSSDIYKSLMTKGGTSYTNYDWRPLQIVPKFMKLITNQMTERLFDIKIEATDKYSTDLRDNHKKWLETVVASKPIYDLAQETFGVNIAPPDIETLPQNNEEIDLWMQMKYKPAIEIVAEEAIKFTLDFNDYQEIQSRVIEDITALGLGVIKHQTDPTKGIQVKWIDPANFIHSVTRNRNFKDCHYFGEVERMTVNELKRISGDTFTDEDIKMLGGTIRDWATYHGNENGRNNGDLPGMMVDVLHFTFKTTNTVTYKKKFTKTGGYNMTKKDSNFGLKKDENNGYEVVKKVIDVWYEGSLVLGTEMLFNYRKCENMIRPQGLLNHTMANYIVYAPDIYQNRTKSLLERIIPYVDQMQQIHIKLQQMVAKARPGGIYIDIDGLNEIDLGGGNFLTPLELIKIYDETGNVLGSSVTAEGDYNYGKEPIRELKNGIVDGLDRLIGLYNHYLNLLRDAIGIPAGADASMPNPDTLVGVQQQVALNSNTATRHILDASLNITKDLALALSLRLKDIFKYSELKEVYINAIGKLGVEMLETMRDFALYDLGINVDIKPDAQEKGYLESNIQMALSRDLITLVDANDIRSIANIKLANKVLEIRSKKREQDKLNAQKEMVKANAEAQASSNAQAAELKLRQTQTEGELKLKVAQTEIEGKAHLLQLEKELKSELMREEFEFSMQLKGAEIQVTTAQNQKKEDEKLKRQQIKDSNTSRMIEQKKFNQPAVNFESSEDNLSGSMDMSEMNPS